MGVESSLCPLIVNVEIVMERGMHFSCLVFVQTEPGEMPLLIADRKRLRARIATILDAFDPDRRVPKEISCNCLRLGDRLTAAWNQAIKEVGKVALASNIDQLRENLADDSFDPRIYGLVSDDQKRKATEFLKAYDHALACLPQSRPDPSCKECGGSGKLMKEVTNPNGMVDFWTIGGRWTGLFDKSYDPTKDDRNIGTCSMCGGQGFVYGDGQGFVFPYPPTIDGKDAPFVEKVCPRCNGEGTTLQYEYADFAGDAVPASELPRDLMVAAMVTPDGQYFDDMGRVFWAKYPPWDVFLARNLSDLRQRPNCLAVIVDCHS